MILLKSIPRELPGRGFIDLKAWVNSGLNFPNMCQGQVQALPFQWTPALGMPRMVELPAAAPKVAWVRKQFPRGVAAVPVSTTVPTTVLSFRTPQNSKTTIDGFSMDLFPSTANEDNYVWYLYVNGVDQFNNPEGQALGRIIRSGAFQPVNFTPEEKIVVEGGSLVEVVVRAVVAVPAADQVSACLSTTVWGS